VHACIVPSSLLLHQASAAAAARLLVPMLYAGCAALQLLACYWLLLLVAAVVMVAVVVVGAVAAGPCTLVAVNVAFGTRQAHYADSICWKELPHCLIRRRDLAIIQQSVVMPVCIAKIPPPISPPSSSNDLRHGPGAVPPVTNSVMQRH
jgi:hypothetical protein